MQHYYCQLSCTVASSLLIGGQAPRTLGLRAYQKNKLESSGDRGKSSMDFILNGY